MMNSEEDYIMEFKAEEKIPHLTVFNMNEYDSDCSTISASEVGSDGCISPIPSPVFKPKKARVMIKKLPRDILALYNIDNESSMSPAQPSRSSGRLKCKQTPYGQYLALHINKPLNEIISKRKRKAERISQISMNQKSTHHDQKCKNSMIKAKSLVKLSNDETTLATRRKLYTKNIQQIVNKPKPTISNSTSINSSQGMPLNDRHFFPIKISSPRVVNNPVSTTFPNFPGVALAKHNLSPHLQSEPFPHKPVNNSPRVEPVVSTTVGKYCSQNSEISPIAQNNSDVQLPSGTTYSKVALRNKQALNAFPTSLMPATCHQKSTGQKKVNTASPASNISVNEQSGSNQRTFTVQAFKVPFDSSKVLIVNKATNRKQITGSQQTVNQNDPGNDIISCNESESDLELSDTEKQTEPEVIKRIIYHTKAVQTKFTCNSSICGLVDSDDFNLNCFYCYDIFPLHKWYDFKEHIKRKHHLEEKENQYFSDANIDKSHLQDTRQMNSHINVTKFVNTASKSLSSKDIALNKENFITKSLNTTEEQVVKKLPLEPWLVAQRLNRNIEPDKMPSTCKVQNTSKKICQTQDSKKSPRTKISNDISNSGSINEIISLDSDEDINTTYKSNVSKTVTIGQQTDKSTSNQTSTSNKVSQINDVKLVLPTLPHIAIKKADNGSPKKPTNVELPATESICVQETLYKLPTNLSIQKVIKAMPKSTSQQLSTNGNIKPRYFVVKKIIKLPTIDTVSKLNISEGKILTTFSVSENANEQNNNDNKIPANNDYKYSEPKPSDKGILFGVTSSRVVIEFLSKLKTLPELWHPGCKNSKEFTFNDGIKKLCSHVNSRFNLNITEEEMILSIQRVKDWYYHMLKNIQEHNNNLNNTQPYKHKFPIYFQILHQFLTSDVQDANTYRLSTQSYSSKPNKIHEDERVTQTDTVANKKNDEEMTEDIIEFDADTLYDDESSDEEVLEAFDETKLIKKKLNKFYKVDGQPKKRTKTYTGSFECDICHKIYKRRCDLKRHRVLHFPPEFECGFCSQKFYFKHWAERCAHIRNKKYWKEKKNSKQDVENSQETPKPKKVWPKKIFRFKMICEICGASYRSIGSLNTHKRDKHLNQRHKCVVCNFTALSNWRIIQHSKKRHIVEPGTVEEVAKKSRARTDTKTPFSNEARQEFFWRKEMRKKLKPGEIFYGCCKCRIIFTSRKEKVLHNKIEHPITETTVICLLCLPFKQLLSNSNCARRHYTDIHKVPWHEIDGLVKRTKPIFNFLNKEEIELLKASADYKTLLEYLLKDKNLEPAQNVIQVPEDEDLEAVENLKIMDEKKSDEEIGKIDIESMHEDKVCVDGIIDHDYNSEEVLNMEEYATTNEHNYSDEQELIEHCSDYDEAVSNQDKNDLYSHHTSGSEILPLAYDTVSYDKIGGYSHNDHEYFQNINDDFVEGELVEESIVVEEYIDEDIYEEQYF